MKSATVNLVVAHHSCQKKAYSRGTPVMKHLFTDAVKNLAYFRCPLCDDEAAVKVEIIEDPDVTTKD